MIQYPNFSDKKTKAFVYSYSARGWQKLDLNPYPSNAEGCETPLFKKIQGSEGHVK